MTILTDHTQLKGCCAYSSQSHFPHNFQHSWLFFYKQLVSIRCFYPNRSLWSNGCRVGIHALQLLPAEGKRLSYGIMMKRATLLTHLWKGYKLLPAVCCCWLHFFLYKNFLSRNKIADLLIGAKPKQLFVKSRTDGARASVGLSCSQFVSRLPSSPLFLCLGFTGSWPAFLPSSEKSKHHTVLYLFICKLAILDVDLNVFTWICVQLCQLPLLIFPWDTHKSCLVPVDWLKSELLLLHSEWCD